MVWCSSLCLQVAEEVGELKVHCRYGCKLKEGSHVEYEADPNSMVCLQL